MQDNMILYFQHIERIKLPGSNSARILTCFILKTLFSITWVLNQIQMDRNNTVRTGFLNIPISASSQVSKVFAVLAGATIAVQESSAELTTFSSWHSEKENSFY